MSKKITYKTNPWPEDPPGEMRVVADFLPTPKELAASMRTQKITLALDVESVRFFKQQAKKYDVPYQVMIRRLLDAYVHRAEG